jgi:DNA polymerase elongation subunit (family B)
MSYISAITRDNKVVVWERNEVGERVTRDWPAPYYFYYDDPDGEYTTIYDTKVSKFECDTGAELYGAKKKFAARDIKLWESDIPPEMRLLSNRYYGKPAPKLNVTFFDIEVDYDPQIGFSSIANPYAPINSVALLHQWKKEIVVLVVPPEEGWDAERLARAVIDCAPDAPIPSEFTIRYEVCADEAELLLHFIKEIRDADIICGWNSDFFDCPYVAQRIARTLDGQELDVSVSETVAENGRITFTFNNNPNPTIDRACSFLRKLDFPTYGTVTFRPVTSQQGQVLGVTVDMVGRIRLDYMALVKKYEPGERASFKLASVSEQVLVDDKTKEPLLPKLEYEGSLADLYRNNFPFFVRYNIRDTEILNGFENKLGYVDVANQMAHLSTALFSHITGTLKLAEYALINFCHHELKRVVKNTTDPEIDRAIDGALVLLPQVGLHERFGSIDVTSLYPTAIRSINISIETIRGQFKRDVRDFQIVSAGSLEQCTLVLESNGKELTMSGAEWRDWLRERNWAVSGYGTVFDQTKQGFIPALLTLWFKERKRYQALKKEAIEAGDDQKAGYYDRLQYVYKIKLNSLYGALTNLYFRFYDLRMGESTTGTGRMVLKHQCRVVAQTLEGNYDVDFPLYDTVKDAMESGYSEEEAKLVALDGPLFNGKRMSDSVIYGDTDSTYFKTYADTIEEAIVIADAVAKKVNDSYEGFMRETFLCTPGFDNLVKAGREIVSDRGIFVEKKRYILHLVDLDGKKVDKMKVMGLDTKKTTLPAEVSAVLNKHIERFLKGESWESVSASIVEYKDELMNSTDPLRIGLPKGVKKIESYTAAFGEDFDARLPGHVAAAIYYNQCLKEYKDKISMPIISGMKIKVFYLIGKHGKFKSIALPTDIEVVPQWFLDDFRIDRDAHIERLVDNPLSNILKAIGKEPPSKQSMYTDSLLVFD